MPNRMKIAAAIALFSAVVYATEVIRSSRAYRKQIKKIDNDTVEEINSIKYAEAKVQRMIAEGHYINKSIVDIGYDFELYRMEYHETK